MTSSEFKTYILQKTKQDNTTFTDAEILALAIPIQDDLAKEAVNANEDLFGMEIYRDLVAGQRNYAFDFDIMQIKILQAKLDGDNWEEPPLIEYDNNNLRINTDENSIVNFFNNYDIQYDAGYFIFGKEIIILNNTAIIDVVDGLKMWAILYPKKLTSLAGTDDMSIRSSTTSIGFPRELHKLFADKVVISWKESQDTPVKLSADEEKWHYYLEKAIDNLKNLNLDRSIIANIPEDDGQDY